MPKEVIQTELAPHLLGDYSQAWTVTGAKLIFVAGQVSVDMSGDPVGVGDIALQTRTVLENVKRVLEGAGRCWRVLGSTIISSGRTKSSTEILGRWLN